MVNLKEDKLACLNGLYERTLIEASLDPFVTISKEGKITDVNKATKDVTGFGRAELIGSDFSNYFIEPEKARKGYKEALLNGFVRDYPLTIKHKSGRLTYVLYNASVYKNEKCEIEGVFAAARDITKTKITEEKLNKKIEEMAKANDLMVGRELRIIELKEKIKELKEKLKIKNSENL
ncbi:MAG: PAS domain S-box protein [Candidatus Pacebacteria bacterium]|nr:PAS domain S-box protein [Candidatus Paceibacterota bacterium]